MIRPSLAFLAVVALAGVAAPAAPIAAAQAAALSAADAAPFIGDWTLNLEGPNGPGTFDLTVKVDNDKVVAEIANPTVPAQPITDIAKADKTLVLRYTFMYDGNPVDAAVSLTPADEGKVKAEISFAGGAYIMTGTAARKEKK